MSDVDALREVMGHPSHRSANKAIDHVDALARRFLAACPIAILGTRRADGGVDQTPRGDPPGFIHVLDDKTIALPERPGNRRADSLENVLHDPQVGLICLIPGHNDTIRISGTAKIVQDATLAETMQVRSHKPSLILMIRVERLMCHCPKALLRASMWRAEGWPDSSDVPSLAEILVAHGALSETVQDIEEVIAEDQRTAMY